MIERPVSRQPIPENAQRVFEGVIFDVFQWDVEAYDGSTLRFEKVRRDDTVVVIPSLSDKRIIIEEEEQPGRIPILTFPAGRMDVEGEDPLIAIKRELLEETGYESDEWTLWRAFQPVTKVDWAVYIFTARNCRKTREADPGPGERVNVLLKTLDEVMELVNEPNFISDDTRSDFLIAKYEPEARALLEKTLFG